MRMFYLYFSFLTNINLKIPLAGFTASQICQIFLLCQKSEHSRIKFNMQDQYHIIPNPRKGIRLNLKNNPVKVGSWELFLHRDQTV